MLHTQLVGNSELKRDSNRLWISGDRILSNATLKTRRDIRGQQSDKVGICSRLLSYIDRRGTETLGGPANGKGSRSFPAIEQRASRDALRVTWAPAGRPSELPSAHYLLILGAVQPDWGTQ